MVRLRLAMSEEETIVPLEVALRDTTDVAEALETFRRLAESQRRQSDRAREVAEHVEAIASIVAAHVAL